MIRRPAHLGLLAALIAAGAVAAPACAVAAPSPEPAPAGTPSPPPAQTFTAQPAPTTTQPNRPTPSLTPSSTATPFLTPTATPTPHPLSIELLRRQEYPGSDLVVEQTLDPGGNYDRYIVSYLSEGLKIYALLTVPQGDAPPTGWPVIVFNHGYIPPRNYSPTERYIAYMEAFAANGYIVFRSDYRGHGQSEGSARSAYSGPGYVTDVLNGVASVSRHPLADPNRIGMWGHSMGGYITLRAMVLSCCSIRAGSIWAGVVAPYWSIVTEWGSLATPNPGINPALAGWRDRFVADYGSYDSNPAFWDSISANTYLADISGPLQIHHGTGDSVVPYEFSEMLYAQMLKARRTVYFYPYEGDDHDITENFDLAMTRTVEFFDFYVKNR